MLLTGGQVQLALRNAIGPEHADILGLLRLANSQMQGRPRLTKSRRERRILLSGPDRPSARRDPGTDAIGIRPPIVPVIANAGECQLQPAIAGPLVATHLESAAFRPKQNVLVAIAIEVPDGQRKQVAGPFIQCAKRLWFVNEASRTIVLQKYRHARAVSRQTRSE